MKSHITFLIASTLLFAGCSDPQTLKNEVKGPAFLDGLYSTRPTVEEPIITIIKLKNPALLETAKKVDGKTVVDEKLVKAIQTEQEAAIKELQKISPDIRVLIRYRLVLNGLAIWAPGHVSEKIVNFKLASLAEKSAIFGRPTEQDEKSLKAKLGNQTSVTFIGSEEAYQQGFKGQGMRVGVIDTGIDYTHKMFLGEGTAEAFKAVNPNTPSSVFPNSKVTGGIDLAGSAYNTGAADPARRIPVPDMNPIDESGHGTHVAGSVAGLGDGVNTYDGVAPDAELYAIKVFGAQGSTSSEVVIAALEYSVDPSGDLSFDKQLDVVNLSLGSNYGARHVMYNHAITNTVKGGTVVVASGGNSGDQKFIVGSPGIAEEAISVASSLDGTNQNIQFPGITFVGADDDVVAEMIEADKSVPIKEAQVALGELVYAGLADKPFSEEQIASLSGKIALIDRGQVSFAEKAKNLSATKALAMIVVNNDGTDPFTMGLGEKISIPAVMIGLEAGNKIKEMMKSGAVTVDLKEATTLLKPWLADTISTFSSRGPRSGDGLIKPEISAPGNKIISAEVGGGAKASVKSGTSMSGPHVAGVMALLKQKFNKLSPAELKSVLLGQGKIIADANKKTYSVSRQGAGRVQVAESINAQVISTPATISLGITDLEKTKTMARELTLKNISTEAVTLKPEFVGSAKLQLSAPTVTLAAGESKKVLVSLRLSAEQMHDPVEEMDGFVQFKQGNKVLLQLPALAVVRRISQVEGQNLKIHATNAADAAGSLVTLDIKNKGSNFGTAYPFNLIAVDKRKAEQKQDVTQNRNCDLQSAGYRLVEKDGQTVLQVAVKLFEGMTTWNRCEVNVQIDANDDNLADQEISGIPRADLPGLTGDGFVSLLLDGNKARALRKKYEEAFLKDPTKATENYSTAVIAARPMETFDNSTLAIIEADLSQLAPSAGGELSLKISTTHQDSGAVEYDDYLANHNSQWHKISTRSLGQSYANLPEVVKLQSKSEASLNFVKGYDNGSLILYTPQNRATQDIFIEDSQSQVLTPIFESN